MTSSDRGPTAFVPFGTTGDLAKRMVIPAFYTLACAGRLQKNWLLVGNAHEDFRAHAHEALTQFGPNPAEASWRQFSKRLLFAGGGFDSNDPGSMLDLVAHARRQLGSGGQLIHYLAVPPAAFAGTTRRVRSRRRSLAAAW